MTWQAIIYSSSREVVLYKDGTDLRDANSSLGESKVQFDGDLPANISRGATIAADGTVTPPTAVQVNDVGLLRAQGLIHARRVMGHMNAQWLFTSAGDARTDKARWHNTWYWMLCPYVALTKALDAAEAGNTTWTTSVARDVLTAYRTLVPDDPERIDFWYKNHDQAIWTGYRAALASDAGAAQVYFGWRRQDALPSGFAADAAEARRWDSTATTGLTRHATIALAATSPEEAVA